MLVPGTTDFDFDPLLSPHACTNGPDEAPVDKCTMSKRAVMGCGDLEEQDEPLSGIYQEAPSEVV